MPAPATAIQLTGSNLDTLGDTGSFEAAYATWGDSFDLYGFYTTSRSATVARTGTYSCKILTAGDNESNFDLPIIQNIASHTIEDYKYYLASCWVYMPSVNSFCEGGESNFYLTRSGNGISIISQTRVNSTLCLDTWKKVEVLYRSDGVFASTNCDLSLRVSDTGLGSIGQNAILYVDDFTIYEATIDNVEYQISATVAAANGPTSATGSITVTVLPAGTYTYSINGGSFGGSNVFSSLLPGRYAIRATVPSSVLLLYVDVTSDVAQYYLEAECTNESVAGANDGTITLTTTTSIGTPFTYRVSINGVNTDQGSNIFTSLAPGNYTCYAYDTYGNQASTSITINSGEVSPVCVLAFNPMQTIITDATDLTTFDGSIQVYASDTIAGGVYRYKLGEDFAYGPSGGDNRSGLFTGLKSGVYTIYARSSTSCLATITLNVGVVESYSTRYRLDFNQDNRSDFYDASGFIPSFGVNNQFRLDVEENGYSGSVTEVKGDGNPVSVSWRGEGEENPFNLQVVTSEIQVNIISETDQQFIDLYTIDEKKFRYKLYIYNTYTSAYELYWQGFGISMLYSEPYINETNYPISLNAIDGLADLSNIEFSDNNGNMPSGRISVLTGVLFCLNKTGLRMSIKDKVNIYAPNMTIDGALSQRYFDTTVYLNDDLTMKSCKEVLDGLLVGCSLFQSNGVWHVESVSEKCSSNTKYFKYDYLGVFEESGTEKNKILIRNSTATSPKVMFADSSAQLKVAQSYGKINVDYDLGIKDNSNLLKAGNFTARDLVNGQFKGWNAAFTSPTELYIEDSPDRDSETCLSIRFNPTTANDPVYLVADPVQMLDTTVDYRLRFSFDVYTRAIDTKAYLYIDFRLTITDEFNTYVVNAYPSGTDLTDFNYDSTGLLPDGYYRVYIDENLSWKTCSFEIPANNTGILQLQFRVSPNTLYDHEDIPSLKSEDSDAFDIRFFNRRRVLYDTISSVGFPSGFYKSIYAYRLEPSDETESLPKIAKPNDSTTYNWNLKDGIAVDSANLYWAQHILLDNIIISYLPAGEKPSEQIIYSSTLNENSNTEYTANILHGDIYYNPLLTLDNPLDENYRNIMDGHFSLADGTPTYGGWHRDGVVESRWYHELISKMIRGHFSLSRWKLTDTWDTRQRLVSFANIFHEPRSGRVFMPMALTVHPKLNKTDFEILENVKGATSDTDDIPDLDPIDSNDNNFRDHSSDHSVDYA